MSTEVKEFNSFSGLQIFVGIDVHKKDWQVCILSQNRQLKNFRQQADPDSLVDHLNKHYPQAKICCAYEAGFSGFWLQRFLQSHKIECWVVHAADIPVTDKEVCSKTDRVDARKIAKALRAQLVRPITIPDQEWEQDRKLIRHRKKVKIDLCRVRNRIKALLNLWGIRSDLESRNWTKKYKKFLKQIKIAYSSGQLVLNSLIAQMEWLEGELTALDKHISELSQSQRYSTQHKLLISIPGIGLLTSIILLTELGDISRFTSLDRLCSYVGLIPFERSSGETAYKQNMTYRSNLMVRTHLIESAWIAIGKDPALTLAYEQYRKSMGAQKAIVKIARKLLNRIRTVLIKQTPYQLGKTG